MKWKHSRRNNTKQMRLDKQLYAYFDRLGEDFIFDSYLKFGSMDKMWKAFGLSDETSRDRIFGRWIRKDTELDEDGKNRKDRWEETKRMKAFGHVDAISTAAHEVDELNYKAKRVEVQAHALAAEHLDRRSYAKAGEVNVNATFNLVTVWGEAMKKVHEDAKLAEPRESPESVEGVEVGYLPSGADDDDPSI